MEIGFEEAKGEVGLGDYEVRSWHGWHRHVTSSFFAHAFLAALRAAGRKTKPPEKGARKGPGNLSRGSRGSEASRGADGLRGSRTLVSVGTERRPPRWNEVLSWSGKYSPGRGSTLLVGMAPSPSVRSQALPLQARRCVAGMNYNCSTKTSFSCLRMRFSLLSLLNSSRSWVAVDRSFRTGHQRRGLLGWRPL